MIEVKQLSVKGQIKRNLGDQCKYEQPEGVSADIARMTDTLDQQKAVDRKSESADHPERCVDEVCK